MPRQHDGRMHGSAYKVDRKQGAMFARTALKRGRQAQRAARAGDCATARAALQGVKVNIEAVRKISYRSLQPSVTHRTVSRLERMYGRATLKVRQHCPR